VTSYYGGGPATTKQLVTLAELLPPGEQFRLYGLTRQAAHAMIQARIEQWRKLPPTPEQVAWLRRRGRWRAGLTRGEASELIGRAGWVAPTALDEEWES
jgi:hypothetical protein